MSEYTQEHLDAVKNDRTPLVDRLRGNYGGRTFDYVPAIQIVAADALAAKDRQIAELTRRVEDARTERDDARQVARDWANRVCALIPVDSARDPCNPQHCVGQVAALLTTATARAERAEKAVEACKPLIDACREEFMGDEGLCDHEPDNEPVMAGLDKKSPITFGMVRAALAAAGTRGEGEKQPQVEAVTDHATKGSAWERWCDWSDARRCMGWKEADRFNAFVAAEVARAGKPRRPAREVAEEVWNARVRGEPKVGPIELMAAAVERDREEGAR